MPSYHSSGSFNLSSIFIFQGKGRFKSKTGLIKLHNILLLFKLYAFFYESPRLNEFVTRLN